MTAPDTEYFKIDQTIVGSNGVAMIVNPARANADLATLKNRFHLDDVLGIMIRAADGTYYHGFLGLILPSGHNYDYHSAGRIIEFNAPKTGQLLRTLNDSGLNTRGRAVINNATDPAPLNKVTVEAEFFSSYHNETLLFGISFGGPNGTVEHEQLGTAIAKQDSVIISANINPRTLEGFIEESQYLNLRAWITNGEGIKYSDDMYTVYLDENEPLAPTLVMVARGFNSTTICAAVGDVAIWVDIYPIIVGHSKFYTDEALTTVAPDDMGRYAFGGYHYSVDEFGVVVNKQLCSSGPPPDPDPVTMIEFVYYYPPSTSEEENETEWKYGCALIMAPYNTVHPPADGHETLYKNNVNNKFYNTQLGAETQDDNDYPTAGFYYTYTEDEGGSYSVTYILEDGSVGPYGGECEMP